MNRTNDALQENMKGLVDTESKDRSVAISIVILGMGYVVPFFTCS